MNYVQNGHNQNGLKSDQNGHTENSKRPQTKTATTNTIHQNGEREHVNKLLSVDNAGIIRPGSKSTPE